MNASRETLPPRAALAAVFASLLLVAVAASGCSRPAKPIGWAAAQPVAVSGQDLVLVPFRGKVFAMHDNSSTLEWQFPPQDKTTYPISEFNAGRLNDKIDTLEIEGTAKNDLKQKVNDLTLGGNTKKTLQDAVSASAASDQEKDEINKLSDEIVSFESDGMKNLKAIYGDLGLSPDKDTTYVATFRGLVFALDTEAGTTRWIRDAGDGIVGGIAVDGDVLYLGTKGDHVYSLDARTGEQRWSFSTKGEVWSTPVLAADTIYTTSLDGSVYALDTSGNQKWIFDNVGSGIAGQVGVADGAVYIGAFNNKLYSLDAADGSLNWSTDADNWFWATPAIQDGMVYAANLDGRVYAVRAEDGSPAWEEPFNTGSPVRSSPVIVGDGLVVASRDAQLFKLNLQTGQEGEGSPALVDEKTIVEADLSPGDGGLVYVVPRSPYLYVFEAAQGLKSRGGFSLPN